MKIQDYLQTQPNLLKPRTICFLINEDKVLLGFKKRGFGKGNYKGIGGKVEDNETIEQGMIRELQEEINIIPTKFKKVAILNFYFPYVDEPDKWNQEDHVFMVEKWDGQIQESDEIYPKWFNKNSLPFETMWADNTYWIPKILNGDTLIANFLFSPELNIEDHDLKVGVNFPI